MTTETSYGDIWVCTDCYFAHHQGVSEVDREATDDECHDWHGGYLRDGHSLPNMVETDHGLMVREWFAGESDTPCDREPFGLWRQQHTFTDNTCSDHEVHDTFDSDGDRTGDTTECPWCHQTGYEDGLADFSWRQCSACGSTLGGSRYRLHVWGPDND